MLVLQYPYRTISISTITNNTISVAGVLSTEELLNILAPDVYCIVLFASPFDCVSELAYLQSYSSEVEYWGGVYQVELKLQKMLVSLLSYYY